jgi:hypothetical protein
VLRALIFSLLAAEAASQPLSIGPERPLIDAAAAGRHLTAISVGPRRFVVWRDEADQLLFAEGGGTPKVIASSPSRMFANRPAIASDGRELFVVWNDPHRIQAVHMSFDGTVRSKVLTIAPEAKRSCFASAVRWNGRAYDVYWIEQSEQVIYDAPPVPFDIRTATVQGARVIARPPVALGTLYPQRIAFAGARPVWCEYRVPFYGPWGAPAKPAPSKLLLQTIGKTIFEEEYDTTAEQPAIDFSIAASNDRFIAVWTESSKLRALVLDRDLNVIGEPVTIGDAIGTTARIDATRDGVAVTYDRLVDGVPQTFIRAITPASASRTWR